MQVADADARALEAQLALERFKAPRTISNSDRPNIVSAMSKYRETKAAVYILGEGTEPNALGRSLVDNLKAALWDVEAWNWSGAGSATGVIVFVKPGTESQNESDRRRINFRTQLGTRRHSKTTVARRLGAFRRNAQRISQSHSRAYKDRRGQQAAVKPAPGCLIRTGPLPTFVAAVGGGVAARTRLILRLYHRQEVVCEGGALG